MDERALKIARDHYLRPLPDTDRGIALLAVAIENYAFTRIGESFMPPEKWPKEVLDLLKPSEDDNILFGRNNTGMSRVKHK